MKILVNSIPMTGLLTGIARYLRNLYAAIDTQDTGDKDAGGWDAENQGHGDQVGVSYFNGRNAADGLPPPADSKNRQITINLLRKLPDRLVFGLRAARWLAYEYHLNKICKTRSFSLYHETALTRFP